MNTRTRGGPCFEFQESKLRLVISPLYLYVSPQLHGRWTYNYLYLASGQADRHSPWASCFSRIPIAKLDS